METAQIREKYLEFFVSKGHLRLPSFNVIPQGDPSLLFINAGMAPLKPYFTGKVPQFEGHSGVWHRVTTCQKSVRTGDIENVGRTNRHQTVFEMLGNFSFGDYFKLEAIQWAWEFLTEPGWLGLDPSRIYVTVYKDDNEAYGYWQDLGLTPDRIHRFDADENFWPQNAPAKGPNGPCGPCSEIYYDRGPEFGGDTWADYYETRESGRFVEIWNLVFPQFDRQDGGVLQPLPKPNIDTGMGLARVAMVLQGVRDFYDTDEFTAIIQSISELTSVSYEGPSSVAHRVIAEHARAVTFLLSDGASFSNTGRGYVVRRLLRRAVRYGYLLGLRAPFMYRLADQVAAIMGSVYPEITEHLPQTQKQIRMEEERFLETLESGIKRLDGFLSVLKTGDTLAGKDAFMLYDTYGFPLDLTLEIADERGIKVHTEGYEKALEEAQALARKNAAFDKDLFKKPNEALVGLAKDYGGTDFAPESLYSEVKLVLVGESVIEEVPTDTEVQVVLDKTPFYAEGGGQVGDKGVLEWEGGWAEVSDTQKNPDGIFLHLAQVREGTLRAGSVVHTVLASRLSTERNHTATHLLHAALRSVMGTHVQQKGSYVGPDRLRFDFSQPQPITLRELQAVETLVNRWIQANFAVGIATMPLEQAKAEGAMALFGEKYAANVRVVSVEGIEGISSKELCGGCHVRRTGEIGLFVVHAEESVAAGVRRVEALTGEAAVRYVQETLAVTQQLSRELGVVPEQLPQRVQKLQDDIKQQEKATQKMKLELARTQTGQLKVQLAGSYSYVVALLEGVEAAALREVADDIAQKQQANVVAVGSAGNLVVRIDKAAQTKGLDAGAIIKQLSALAGGRGGGKGLVAQGGGFDLEKALDALPGVLL
jgi:alanyl-tRNA synthetase